MEIADLTLRIQAALPDAEVYLRDLTGGGNHFEAFVVSSLFQGQSRINRQRQVMDGIKDLLDGPLHAITFKTYTPEEWESSQA